MYKYVLSFKIKIITQGKKKLSRKSVVYAGPSQDKIYILAYNKLLPRVFKNCPKSTKKKVLCCAQ